MESLMVYLKQEDYDELVQNQGHVDPERFAEDLLADAIKKEREAKWDGKTDPLGR